MSDYLDDYEARRERRREEERQYRGDVFYNVWRNGGNPDRINYDRVSDSFRDGIYHEDAALREMRAQRPKPQEPEYPEEQYPDEQPEI